MGHHAIMFLRCEDLKILALIDEPSDHPDNNDSDQVCRHQSQVPYSTSNIAGGTRWRLCPTSSPSATSDEPKHVIPGLW